MSITVFAEMAQSLFNYPLNIPELLAEREFFFSSADLSAYCR